MTPQQGNGRATFFAFYGKDPGIIMLLQTKLYRVSSA